MNAFEDDGDDDDMALGGGDMPEPMELHEDQGEGEGLAIVDRYDRLYFRCEAAIPRLDKFHDVCTQMESILAPAYTRWMRNIQSATDILPKVLGDMKLWEDGAFRDVVPGGDRIKACKTFLEEIDDIHHDIWTKLRPSLQAIMDQPLLLNDLRDRAADVMSLAQDVIGVMNAVRCILQAHADILQRTASNVPPLFIDPTITAYGAFVCQPIAPFTCHDAKDDRVKLTTFLLAKLAQRGLRKRRGVDLLYEEVFLDKQRTYTFQPISTTIEELVYQIFRRENGGAMWNLTTRGALVADVVKYIKNCVDTDIPELKPIHSLRTFKDGMYCIRRDLFVPWNHVEEVFGEELKEGSAYNLYKDHEMGPAYYVDEDEDDDEFDDDTRFWQWAYENQHFTAVFNDPGEDDMGGTRRPLEKLNLGPLMKLLRDQGFTNTTIFLLLASLGRMQFNAGELDSAQYWPVLHGVAGSGKSTIFDIFRYGFHSEDVGTISADSEERFGRDRLARCRFVMIPDLRGERMGLSAEFFLTAVGRDAVVIPVKYGSPIVMDAFNIQGIIATNQFPQSWTDDPAGAKARRMLIFPFMKSISPRDPNMKDRIIKNHFAQFIRGISLAYRMLPKDMDIAADYPITDEMKQARSSMLRASNSLIDFLITYGNFQEGETTLIIDLEVRWREHVRNSRPSDKTTWSVEYYDHALRSQGCRVEQDIDGQLYAVGVSLAERAA